VRVTESQRVPQFVREELDEKALIHKAGEVLSCLDVDFGRGVVCEPVAKIGVGGSDVRNPTDGDRTTAADDAVEVIENDVVLPVGRAGKTVWNLTLIRLR